MVLVEKGSVPFQPAPASPGPPPTYGDYFPTATTPQWLSAGQALTGYTSDQQSLDLSDPHSSDFQNALYASAQQHSLSQDVSQAPDGACYHIQVWQFERKQTLPPPPFGSCRFYPGPQLLTYDYWYTEPPTFGVATQVPNPCDGAGGQNEIETIDFAGASPIYIGIYLGVFYARGGYFTIAEYSATCDPLIPEDTMPAPAPVAPLIPDTVPVPPVPKTAPAPVFLTGSVSTVNPPLTASVTSTNNNNGTVTVNYQFVCCPGPAGNDGLDAVQPRFSIGTVENVPPDESYVDITGGPIDFVLDFGLPLGDTILLTPISIPLSVVDPVTNQATLVDVLMYGASDGTHNQDSFISAIFNQFQQIRTKDPVFEIEGPPVLALIVEDGTVT